MKPPVGPSPSLPPELRSALRSLVENRVRPSRDRIGQAMGLVNGAVGDLGSTFQRMRQHAEAQRQRLEDLILRSYRLMNEDEDPAPSSYQGLLGETGRFLQAFGDVLLHFSRHSVEAAHQLDEMSERVEQIFSISEQISQISMDSNLLAINAAIEAANAGEAGKGFAIVATNIRELSKSIDHLNATIQGQAQETRSSIAVLSELISRMASHDLGGALQINRSIDHMRQTITDLATRLEEARTHMKTYAEEVSQNASDAIRLLQFGDITHQVLQQAEAGLDSMAEALGAMEAGGWDNLELQAPRPDPVAQTGLDAGDIELF